MKLTTDEALSAGQKYLGPDYREIGKPGSGVFHSADGTKAKKVTDLFFLLLFRSCSGKGANSHAG